MIIVNTLIIKSFDNQSIWDCFLFCNLFLKIFYLFFSFLINNLLICPMNDFYRFRLFMIVFWFLACYYVGERNDVCAY